MHRIIKRINWCKENIVALKKKMQFVICNYIIFFNISCQILKFVNSYLKEYLTKRNFIVVLKSSRSTLQEYAVKNGDFHSRS